MKFLTTKEGNIETNIALRTKNWKFLKKHRFDQCIENILEYQYLDIIFQGVTITGEN